MSRGNTTSSLGVSDRHFPYGIIFTVVLFVTFFILFLPSLKTVYASPYHFDEAYSIYIAKMPWLSMEYILLRGADTHPPLYNNLLKFWMIFSESHVWLRLSSILLALGSLVVVYLTCRENINEKVGVFSTLIMATSGLFISLGGSVTLYMLYLFLSSLSIYYFFRFLRKPDWKSRLFYVLSTVLGMYVYWFFAYVVLSEVLFFLWSRRSVKAVIDLYLHVALLCMPLMPFLFSQLKVLEYASVVIFSRWVDKMSMSVLADFFVNMTTTGFSAVVFLIAFAGGLIYKVSDAREYGSIVVKIPQPIRFLLLLLVLTIALSAVIDSLGDWNFFVDRHLVFLIIPLSVLLAYFVVDSQEKLLAVLLLLAVGYNFYTIVHVNYTLMQDTPEGKIDELTENSGYDLIIHVSPFTFFPGTVHDWDNRAKHKVVYYKLLETNPVLEYAIKGGVLDETNFIQSCDDLMFKKARLVDSNSWANIHSLQNMRDKCYWENLTWRDCRKRYWNGSTWRDCDTDDCEGDCALR